MVIQIHLQRCRNCHPVLSLLRWGGVFIDAVLLPVQRWKAWKYRCTVGHHGKCQLSARQMNFPLVFVKSISGHHPAVWSGGGEVCRCSFCQTFTVLIRYHISCPTCSCLTMKTLHRVMEHKLHRFCSSSFYPFAASAHKNNHFHNS